jgi:hypothetical protein
LKEKGEGQQERSGSSADVGAGTQIRSKSHQQQKSVAERVEVRERRTRGRLFFELDFHGWAQRIKGGSHVGVSYVSGPSLFKNLVSNRRKEIRKTEEVAESQS